MWIHYKMERIDKYKEKFCKKKDPFWKWVFRKSKNKSDRYLNLFIFIFILIFNSIFATLDHVIINPLLTVISQYVVSIFLNLLIIKKKNSSMLTRSNLISSLKGTLLFHFIYLVFILIYVIFGIIFSSPLVGLIIGLSSTLMLSLYVSYDMYISDKIKNIKLGKSDLRELRLSEILK